MVSSARGGDSRTGTVLPSKPDWRPQPDGVTISVADVTPEMRIEMLAWFERWLKPGHAK